LTRELVLVGGGHTHVEVVRRFGEEPIPGWSLTLVSAERRPVYSGMVPGFVAGHYAQGELEIDLAELSRRSGVRLVHARALRVDPANRLVHLEHAAPVAYDIASLDIGSGVSGVGLPGVRENALHSRPIEGLVAAIEARLAAARAASSAGFRLAVIGAGAGGLELAFCLRERLLREGAQNVETTIVDRTARLLEGGPPRLASRLARAARTRGLRTCLGHPVLGLEPGLVRLDGAKDLPFDLALWVTGPAAHPLARESGLPIDPAGFIRIGPTFAVEGRAAIFAVGDCASLPGMQKAGVYAVRAGPVLDRNLRAAIAGRPLRVYRPQPDFLSLLNLGDGTAVGAKWGLTAQGAWVMKLKDRIDRAFVRRYRAPDPAPNAP
jgi:selenide,water dikinase